MIGVTDVGAIALIAVGVVMLATGLCLGLGFLMTRITG
jgi:hypothetical protein